MDGWRPKVATTLATSWLIFSCDGPGVDDRRAAPSSGTATVSAPVSAMPAPSASGPPVIYVPLPGEAQVSARAIDARWPAEGFVAAPSRLAGFEVFRSPEVAVSIKRHHVEPVRQTKDEPFPACPSIDAVRARAGVEVMSRGGGSSTPDGTTPSWMVYRDRGKLGVIAVRTVPDPSDYGTTTWCCLSGNELDANAARATLDGRGAKIAMEACLAALHAR